MAPLKLYGSVISTATMRALACLKEKELDFEFVSIDMGAGEHKKEPFLSLNPFGQVPALEDGDLKLFDSRAISNYIVHTYSDKGAQLLPGDGKKMAVMSVWMEVEAHQFDPLVSKLAWELVYKVMFGMTTDPAIVSETKEKLGRVLDVYEARLANSKYLGGDTFTQADLHHLPCLHYLMGTEVKELISARPRVAAWCSDIMARPAWAEVLAMQPGK